MKKRYFNFILCILIATIFVAIFYGYISNKKINQYVKIYWNSMNPTLIDWKLYPIRKVEWINDLNRNDIVLFEISWSNNEYIKRLKILPWDKYNISFENNQNILVLTINWKYVQKFINYKTTIFYKTLLLWSNNTPNWWVKAPQCWVFWDNLKNSIDSLKFWFIWCNKITHKIIN